MIGIANQIGKENIDLQPNKMYYMGHSSSPSPCIVTDVSEDYVSYVKWPFYGLEPRREEKKIMVWLIAPAIKTRLSQMEIVAKQPYGKSEAIQEEIKEHKAFLDGGNIYNEVVIADYERLDVDVKPTEKFEEIRGEVRNKDYWYYAERYGCVGGYGGEREGEYMINGITRGELNNLIKDGYSEVLSVNPEKI